MDNSKKETNKTKKELKIMTLYITCEKIYEELKEEEDVIVNRKLFAFLDEVYYTDDFAGISKFMYRGIAKDILKSIETKRKKNGIEYLEELSKEILEQGPSRLVKEVINYKQKDSKKEAIERK